MGTSRQWDATCGKKLIIAEGASRQGEIIAGILISAFIVCVNFIDWFRGQTLSSCDRILLALGIFNMLYPCLNGLMLYVNVVWSLDGLLAYLPAIYLLTVFTSLTSSWITALLCLFYCVKIVHFKMDLLVRLKMKIDRMVPWLILVAGLISFISSIPVIWGFTKLDSIDNTSSVSANITSIPAEINDNGMLTIIPLIPNILLPFLIVMVTTISNIWSLYIHTNNMEQNLKESSNLKIHRRAAKTMLSLLLLYCIFYVAEMLKQQIDS
ncbi:taste receptor type 2 member 40-like [Discoglossus pictus]